MLRKNILLKAIPVVAFSLLFAGCAKNQDSCVPEQFESSNSDSTCTTKPYQMKNNIIVGSRQDDAKVVYSVGKILKAWIAPYYQGGTLIAAHDNYVVVEKPRFLVGESVDKAGSNPDGVVTPTRNFPFAYRDEELDRAKPNQRFSNKNVKKFVNNVYKSRSAHGIPAKSRTNKANAAYDKGISEFLGKDVK